MDIQNNISFQAKLGNNVQKILKKEFKNDKNKLARFEKLFEDAFTKNLDNGTIIDLDKNNQYVFSHVGYNKIKHKTNISPVFKISYSYSLLQECPKTLARIENKMFRTIISKSINAGEIFENLQKKAEHLFTNQKSLKEFIENISVAKRLKQKFPKSKLKDFEFDYMTNIMLEEEANKPGTDLYNLIHNFGGLSWE